MPRAGCLPSGFWAWLERTPSAHALEDERLGTLIAEIHRDSRETYGVPRGHAELRDRGVRCSRKRIARLMRQRRLAGLMGWLTAAAGTRLAFGVFTWFRRAVMIVAELGTVSTCTRHARSRWGWWWRPPR